MIPKDLIEKISHDIGIRDAQLLEKDLLLQGILVRLSESDFFAKNFAFKGGTCLTKAYFGYYRFSEDLDFTWLNQKAFEKKTKKQVRKIISAETNKILDLLVQISEKNAFEFKPSKKDPRFVQLGGSNRFATFKFWYPSAMGNRETFLKIQFNFVEKLFYKPKKRSIRAIALPQKERMLLEYPEFADCTVSSPKLFVYDLKEIAAEKIRAILTRRGFKARDIIDLYWLSKKGITVQKVRLQAIQKTLFMLSYLKYRQNLENKQFAEKIGFSEEQLLSIQPAGKDFDAFANKTLRQLNALAEEIRGGNH